MLVKEMLFKDLNKKQKEVIKKLSNLEIEDFDDFDDLPINGIFLFSNTKEGGNYWKNITVKQFEKDILEEKFNYLPEINVNNLSTNLNKIITKLNNYVNIKTN